MCVPSLQVTWLNMPIGILLSTLIFIFNMLVIYTKSGLDQIVTLIFIFNFIRNYVSDIYKRHSDGKKRYVDGDIM